MKAKILAGLVAVGLFGDGVVMASETPATPKTGSKTVARAAQGGGFGATCRNVRLEYPLGPYHTPVELCAECGDGKGGWIDNCGDAAIHLDWVVGNSGGHLVPAQGGFQNTCGSCGVYDREASENFPFGMWAGCSGKSCLLSCGVDGKWRDGYGCGDGNGKWTGSIFSFIDLNACVANRGGHLAWIC